MAALPRSSTVVVHTVVDGQHSAMIFTEVDVVTEVPEIRFSSDIAARPTYAPMEYVISGVEGYVFRRGDDPTQVYVTALAHQAEETAEVRKERDEARRERDAALQEMAVLKANLLRIIDPDSSDDDDDDYCEQCNDYHDWGEEG